MNGQITNYAECFYVNDTTNYAECGTQITNYAECIYVNERTNNKLFGMYLCE